jgi:Protein of unknown function (DUF2971)
VGNADESLQKDMEQWSVYQMYAAAQSRSDGFLYHYTNINALKSILDDAQVWGTHVAYLNDTREFSHGIDAIAGLAEQVIDDITPRDDATKIKTIMPLLMIIHQAINDSKDILDERMGPYVSCFSQSVDDLSQWRGYANGGYAIKFDPEILKDSVAQVAKQGDDPLPEPCAQPHLTQVEYIPERQYERVKQLFVKHSASFYGAVQVKPEDFDAALDNVHTALIQELVPLAASLKHHKFVGEAEFRLVSHSSASFYSPSPSVGLVPRIRFGFAKEAVKGVLVGPGQFMDAKKRSLDRYLARRYPGGAAATTEVPYREL